MSSEQPDSVVNSLRLERLQVQKKTFSKWANIHLQKFNLEIDDLFQDMGDGVKLMKLLESLSGEKLGKPAKGTSRIKRIENVSRCLMFLHSKKMRLENISSEDIVDGKPHLILGLLWMIILRYEIPASTSSNAEPMRTPSLEQTRPVQTIAKESLMLWCQSKTNGYPRVNVKDFHRSWRDGLAFNALIHSHVPTLVDFYALKPKEHIYNLENAFSIAQKHIGVPRLLDPEDVDTDNPDEKSILVYVSTFCKGLGKYREELTGGRRIANVIGQVIEVDKMEKSYSDAAIDLVNWINAKINYFKFQVKLESLDDIQREVTNFKTYRTEEKPLQSEKKNEVEVLYFNIQMKRLNPTGWLPSDTVSPTGIENAWSTLEKVEHEHEIRLRNLLKERERLENLAYKFDSKRTVREGYMKEIQKILTDPNYGANIKQSDATFKKHEAIRTGIIAREAMIQDLFKIADVLIESNYWRKEEIIAWKSEAGEKWSYLLRLLEAYDEKFSNLREIITILNEMDSVLEEMQQLKSQMDSETEPLDISDSLQKHALKEVQVSSWSEAIHRFEKKVEKHNKVKDINLLQTQVKKLRDTYESLVKASHSRREMLEEQLKMKEHNENVEEMLAWIFEKQLYCTANVFCKDLASALVLQKNHKALESELMLKKELIENMEEPRLKTAILELEEQWKKKAEYVVLAFEAFEFIGDAEECASWISETMHLLETLDYGSDELTCEALLRRHLHMETKITAGAREVKELLEASEKIGTSLKKVPKSTTRKTSASKNTVTDAKFLPEEFISNCKLLPESIYKRQQDIEESYSDLKNKSQIRKIRLHQYSTYFNFKDRCDEIEQWMREKEKVMDSNDFGDEAEEVEKHFEVFLTDMVAHGLIIDDLESICNELEKGEAEQAKTAKMLLEDIKRRWSHLNKITRMKEQNLKGQTSLLLAHRMCEGSITFLNETLMSENTDTIDNIRNFEDLRRKQEAIEREMNVAEERVKQALVLAENVYTSYPNENELQARVKILEDNWKKFQIQTRERQVKIKQEANVQIFKTKANYLVEWSDDIQHKLRMREKISDLSVAQSVSKDHKDIGNEIDIQDFRFNEIEELGHALLKSHPEIQPVLHQLSESRKIVRDLWNEKDFWISQSLDLQTFDREANQLQSICRNQNKLLDCAEIGGTLSDIKILKQHHDSFIDTLTTQKNRFLYFDEMAAKLMDSNHEQKDFIYARQKEIHELREEVLQKTNERTLRLDQEFLHQKIRADAHEMIAWIAEKNKRIQDLSHCDRKTQISYKIKRLETLEAELTARQDDLQTVYAKGEMLSNECDSGKENVAQILEKEYNLLCERLEIYKLSVYSAKEVNEFNTFSEIIEKKIEEVKRSTLSSYSVNDHRSVKNHLQKQKILENELEKLKGKVTKLKEQGENLMEGYDCDQDKIESSILNIEQKLKATEQSLITRRENLEICKRFHQLNSELERELMWISDQVIFLSTDIVCKNLLEAQKLQKKLENLEVTLEFHKKVVENLSMEVLKLIAEEECTVDITKTCELMEDEWKKLLCLFNDKKTKTSFIVRAQMFYSEASEIDAWLSEKKQMLSNTDYGKGEDMIIKLLTKQKDIELEIDSYKGLVEELSHQAQALIDIEHQDSKLIKNRMEMIEQDMKNLQNLCLARRQKLLESKNEIEFEKETVELGAWINEQMSHASSQDFGDDYEHVMRLHTNFEFYRKRVEAGEKRILQYEDFAKRLKDSKCEFIDKVNKDLGHLSSLWTQLLESLEGRAFQLEAALEIHRFHRDVTDVLERITGYYTTLPNDLGSSLSQAQQLGKKHDAIENELLGIEAQLHLLVEDSQKLIHDYPGGNEEYIQLQLNNVIENWNSLQKKVATRKDNLLAAQLIHKFLVLVREEEAWSKQMCFELESNNISKDLEQIANEHEIINTDIETRLAKYEDLKKDGKALLEYNIFHNQINERLQTLSEIEQKVKNSWSTRCSLIARTKAVVLFFNEGKQIQSSFATKEVQLCGSEMKETLEDLESALKKHTEFQKSMKVQEEKFTNWEQQGKTLLKEQVPESERIMKKLEELSERRERLLNFSTERSEALSNALRLAKFKSDTIEFETWIKEKKNKLKLILKDYNHLNADEKIKRLQKQQAIQAEIEAHEPIIQRIIEQKKEIPSAGGELNVRFELILENWNEVKGSVERMARDLKEAQDMLVMHDYFEKAEKWLKEKELLIQQNDTGKDYEHCILLQMKLDDNNSGTKIDDQFIENMKQLAWKISKKENQHGVYVRYERISERWTYLKEEISLYRKKLSNAAEIHAFVKDLDDTIDRMREKMMILSARHEVRDLTAAELMRRKFEAIEKDLTAVDKKLKEQCNQGNYLAERYELSAGRIHDKINQAKREWSELQMELESKKKNMDAIYTSLKYSKDVEDLEKIVSDIIKEMEYAEEPSDRADAISFLQAHQHYETQISTFKEKIQGLEEYGEDVLKIPGVRIEEIQNSMKNLSLMKESIQLSYDCRLSLLTKFRYVYTFLEKAKQIETWFASKEAFLANKDVGDSMSSVEALIRKQESFEKTCTAYLDKLQELEVLISDIKYYEDCEEIENHYKEICSRKDRLLEGCKKRKALLNDSKSLQQMLLHLYEVSNWMKEKIQLVSDESYKDLTNLISKIQKHATLQAEILANHSRVVSITEQADDMLENSHFASDKIREQVQNLEDLWQKLIDSTNERKVKLDDAYNALKFKQKLEDISSMLDEIETHLEYENYSLDVVSIQQETDKLEDILKDMEEIGDKMRILSEASEKFDHSSKQEILNTFNSIEERFHYINGSIINKSSKLEEEFLFSGLEKDVNDELSWIEENIAVCQSEEYFDNVTSVQILQKKLEALETEMTSREPLINSLLERASRMNSSESEAKARHLEKRFQELKDAISLRRLRLSDALESQTFYFEVAQAEIWMNEKMTQISSSEPGVDLYSVQEQQKKINAIQAATNGFKQNINSLEELSSDLIGRGHYDSINIRMKQEDLNNRYEQLTCSILKKIALLREEEEFFSYLREVNTVISQLKAISNATHSNETGRDVEHVESLMQKLDVLRSKLCGYERTVKNLQQKANSLLEGKHTESERIKELLMNLEDAWLECDYSSESRFKTLDQAKHIHSFRKSADETISWIFEKDVALSSINYDHDLQTIEILLRHHETLERDLKAIQKQVDALYEESTALSEQFPDAKDSVEEKYKDVVRVYEKCSEKAADSKEKLLQAEQMQSYFDEARDFQAWIWEMEAIITQVDLLQDVAACEAALAHHDEYKSEIDSHLQSFKNFETQGQEFISSGHFLSLEIDEKLKNLNSSFETLLSVWENSRKSIEQNLDLQLFKKKAKELDNWLRSQEYNLVKDYGRSLEEVNYLVQKHEQLEQKIILYEEKFQELLTTTKIEEELEKAVKERRKSEEWEAEQRKLEIKKKEEERLLEERRKERAQFDIPHGELSDDDIVRPNTLPEKEQVFKRYDSRRKFANFPVSVPSRTVPAVPVQSAQAPPTRAEGFLHRKQETLSGGKRSTIRGWKTYYTVLCGQLLCFFKDKKSFIEKNAAKPPISIYGARCSFPEDYRKKKFVFRLEPTDNSSFLFEALNEVQRIDWVSKINYTSGLEPRLQLKSFDEELPTEIASRKDSIEVEAEEHEGTRSKERSGTLTEQSESFGFLDHHYEVVNPYGAGSDPGYGDVSSSGYGDVSNSGYGDTSSPVFGAVSNPIYSVAQSEASDRSDMYEDVLHSARSSWSNQSYTTAFASSSTSTLHDERTESSEEDTIFSSPQSLSKAKSEMSLEEPKQTKHDKASKRKSLPPKAMEPKKQEGKKKWSVFSLRRK